MKLAQLLFEPWATPYQIGEALQATGHADLDVAEFKGAKLGPEGVLLFGMRPSEHAELDVRDGVAVIPVRGFMTARAYWRGDRASYEWVGEQLSLALASPQVQGVVLDVDSGGGQVAGCEELATRIFEARKRKPIASVARGMAASAAYWIASAAKPFHISRTTELGSIGVLWRFFDWSKYDAKIGLKEITLVSSQSPDKDLDPTTRHGRDRIQATLDQLAGVFVTDVARNRGVTEDTVLSEFGQGWVRIGAEAVEAGMADAIANIDETLAQVRELASRPSPVGGASQETSMDTVNLSDITAEWVAEHLPAVAEALRQQGRDAAEATHQTALEAVRTEATAKGTEAGATAERERILAIEAEAEGLGHEDLVASHKADPAKTAADLAQAINAAERAAKKAALGEREKEEEEANKVEPSPGGEKGETEATVSRIVGAAQSLGVVAAKQEK